MLATPLGNTAIRRWTAHRARRKLGTVILLITHDLGVVAEFAELVVVMYAGRVVETAGVRGLFRQPQHPYTAGLLRSMPRIDDRAAPFATHRTNCGTWRFDGDDLLPLSPAAMRAKRRDFQIIFRDPFSDAGRPGRRMPILRQLLVPGGVPLLWVQTLVFYREDGSIDRERLPSPSVANTLVTAPARSYGGPAFCRCVIKSRMHA